MEIRELKREELLEDNLINKEDFPEVIFLDSDSFRLNPERYLDNCTWYGLFDNEELVCACSISNEGVVGLELIETKVDCKGQGYGSKMMDFIIDTYGHDYDIDVMCMYKDLDKFYERWSFKEIKGEPMLKMLRKRK